MIYLLFLLLGIAQDFCGANWVVSLKRRSYTAGAWAFCWSLVNSTFVLTLARSLDWGIVPFYASGIAIGTLLVVLKYRIKGE